jgi:predicted ABC-type sugar transport system permease subunit
LGLAVGGPALVVLGGAGLVTGAVVGTFLGAMLSRGTEKEAADFYDQAVERGKLLVVVEIHQPGADERLAVAERLLADAGAEPLPLPEG